ncbi:MAG: hypothetical protein E7E23_13410, partial [Paenibacillus sp.]|uniref:hypothetical protein n=1 Tax=Paenibacillus sp. TaxID=58172 RepID=UPI0028FF7EB9
WSFVNFLEPPYADPHVRWCERTGVSHPLLLDCSVRKTCKSAGIFEKLARFERKPAKVQVFFRIEGNSGVCASKACTFAGILINRQACAQKTALLQENKAINRANTAKNANLFCCFIRNHHSSLR